MNSEIEKKENGEQRGRSSSEEEELCPICLKTIGDVDCYVTKCGHKFHGSCMLNWCQIREDTDEEEVCPMCRGQLKKNIDFPAVTKNLLYNFIQIMNAHNVSCESLGEFEYQVMWMQLPVACQQELIEALEYHYFVNEEALYLGTDRERETPRMSYNFSLSDLSFHL